MVALIVTWLGSLMHEFLVELKLSKTLQAIDTLLEITKLDYALAWLC